VNEPAAQARVDGRGNIVVQALGSGNNVVVNAGIAHLRLTQFEGRTARVVGQSSDAALLSAYRSDVVPLLGRDAELADLKGWLARDAGVSVRVLTGAGGRGKTRLALELARQASGDGWLAGMVEPKELDRFRSQQNVADWGWDGPTLVVADDAASRVDQLRDWLGELADAPRDQPPLRMLLLERQAQPAIGWMTAVFGRGEDDSSRAAQLLLDPVEPVELAAIDDLEARRRIFAALLTRKRADLAAPEPGRDAEFDRLLRDEELWGNPLFLMMAGLVAGEVGVKDVLTLPRTDLATSLARRELERIGRIAAGAGVDASNRRHPGLLAQHLAVLTTLAQGLSAAEARKLIEEERSRLGSSADVNATLVALRDGLPAGEGTPEIAPILPKIIGEAAVLAWLGDGGELPGLGIDAVTFIQRVARGALGDLSEVLVRCAQDFAAAGREEPVRWLRAVAQVTEGHLGALTEIVDRIPANTLALRSVACDLSQLIVDRSRLPATESTGDDTEAQEALSVALNNLGARLGELGRREEALAAGQEAIDIKRRLAKSRPDALLPGLADGLDNIATDLSWLGRREEALAASQESVDIYRRLAQTHADAFLSRLAVLLNNLSVRLSNVGRREEALAASQEAVDTLRRVMQTRPDVVLSDLATSLDGLGGNLASAGRLEEALAATQEAVGIKRRLAQSRPDTFLPSLASGLDNLGYDLSNVGRHEEALAASQEALDVHRRLARAQPGAFLPNLALNLMNFGSYLRKVGRNDDSLAASQEAVDLYRRLAQARPDAVLPSVATSLGGLAQALAAVERYADAQAAAREALSVITPFVVRETDAFGHLTKTLTELYVDVCKEAGVEPDAALVAPILRALGVDDTVAALQAQMIAIMEAAEKAGSLDETELAKLPPRIADHLREVWASRSASS
jgi:tetratricopeptide (TPR) repeat protein